jgi:PAS domain S-box-containing protein
MDWPTMQLGKVMEGEIIGTESALEAVRQAEQKYRSIFEHCVIGIFQTTPEGQYLSANPALARMYGYNSSEELIGALTDINRQLYVKSGRRAEFLKLVREHGKVIDFESQIYRRDKSVIWILESARLVRDEVSSEVLYYEGMVQDITQRKLAEEERDQANARLTLQYVVTRTLAEVQHLGEVSGKVVQSICETMSWDVGGLWYVDTDANLLRCADVWHRPGVNVHAFIDATQRATFASGMGLPGRVWSSRKAFWIPNVVVDDNFPRAAEAAQGGLHSAFAFPIILGGEVTGVMEFFSRGIHAPDDDLLSTLTALGTQIGKFIERERMAEQLAQYTENC